MSSCWARSVWQSFWPLHLLSVRVKLVWKTSDTCFECVSILHVRLHVLYFGKTRLLNFSCWVAAGCMTEFELTWRDSRDMQHAKHFNVSTEASQTLNSRSRTFGYTCPDFFNVLRVKELLLHQHATYPGHSTALPIFPRNRLMNRLMSAIKACLGTLETSCRSLRISKLSEFPTSWGMHSWARAVLGQDKKVISAEHFLLRDTNLFLFQVISGFLKNAMLEIMTRVNYAFLRQTV